MPISPTPQEAGARLYRQRIDELYAKIRDLEAENAALRASAIGTEPIRNMDDAISVVAHRFRKLEDALRPFAAMADDVEARMEYEGKAAPRDHDELSLTLPFGSLRRARDAILPGEGASD